MNEQAWAKERLLELAGHLLPNGYEIAQLRAASVSPARIEALYPFAFSEWRVGISDLTHDAEWFPDAPKLNVYDVCERDVAQLLADSWKDATRELAGALAKEWRTQDLAEAWSAAIDDRNPSIAPHILSFTVLLLAALASNRAHPKSGAISQLVWDEHLREFAAAVNRLVELLQACDWRCETQRNSEKRLG